MFSWSNKLQRELEAKRTRDEARAYLQQHGQIRTPGAPTPQQNRDNTLEQLKNRRKYAPSGTEKATGGSENVSHVPTIPNKLTESEAEDTSELASQLVTNWTDLSVPGEPTQKEALPDGWFASFDIKSGEIYYFNARTDERTWTRPPNTEE